MMWFGASKAFKMQLANWVLSDWERLAYEWFLLRVFSVQRDIIVCIIWAWSSISADWFMSILIVVSVPELF